jgi:hypothetical protein
MRYALLSVVLWAVASQGAHAQAVSAGDELAFTQQMQQRLAAADPDARFAVSEPLTVSVANEQMQDGVIYLHRIFDFCLRATVQDCESAKATFVSRINDRPVPPSRSTLRVIVRDASYAANVREMFARNPSGPSPFIRDIGDDLSIVMAADSPTQIALMTTDMLEDIGLTEQAAWDIALANTAAALPSVPTADQLAENAVAFEVPEYAASMLAQPERWRGLAEAIGPDLFVTAVSDQFVFVGVMAPGARLEAFKQSVAEDCAAQERCVSPNLYRWRDGRWVVAR